MDRDSRIAARVAALYTTVARVAARYAAVEDGKLKDLLLKVRKGTTTSFNWKQLGEVLAAMGGKVEKTVVAVPLWSPQSSSKDEYYADEDRAAVERKHAELSKALVSSVPSKPKAGQLYVTKITEIRQHHSGDWEFDFVGYMGNEAWNVILGSDHMLATPSYFDFGTVHQGFKPKPGAKIAIYDTLKWLDKSTNWRERAEGLLEMAPVEPSVPRTRESTGSCGVCFSNVKIKPGEPPKLVLHGYRRPGTGEALGSCFGVGYAPFELSPAASKDFLKGLEQQLKSAEDHYESLKGGQQTSFKLPFGNREVSKGDVDWSYELERELERRKNRLDDLETEVKIFETLIKKWKERPLPKEGERHINWYFEGRK